jgi:3' terminal RNA ribose 2'-O-methyltransferase Hen1
VLIPVLDDDKHYWVGDDEVNKLLSKGEGWLSDHPAKDQIALRYLKHRRHLARAALDRLVAEEVHDIAEQDQERAKNEDAVEEKLSLNEQRIDLVVAALKVQGARSVIDLGCGEGKLMRALLHDKSFERIAGADVSPRAIEFAKSRLRVEQLPPKQQARLSLFQAALTYRDQRFAGYDAACAHWARR